MSNVTASWKTNLGARRAQFRATWLAITAASLIFAQFIRSLEIQSGFLLWTVIILPYLAISALLARKYVHEQRAAPEIYVLEGVIHLPGVIRNDRRLQIEDIRSLERHCTHRHDFGVFVGRAKRSPVFIQQEIFASPHDFEEFIRIVSLSIRANLPERTLEETEAVIVRRKNLNHLPLIILASLLFATFLICSASIERISDSALELGCLTKNSLQPSQLYRFGSSFFLHINPWHLGLNIICLAIVGRNVQVILGLDRFVNILFLSAFGGSLFSLAFSSFDAVIGASGGVMGLLGAYSFLCLKYQTDLPGSVQTSVRMVLLALVLQVVFDIATPAVDSCSHAGGFFTGLLYVSIATNRRRLRAAAPSIAERFIAVAISLAIASALVQFFARYGALLRLAWY